MSNGRDKIEVLLVKIAEKVSFVFFRLGLVM